MPGSPRHPAATPWIQPKGPEWKFSVSVFVSKFITQRAINVKLLRNILDERFLLNGETV